MSGGLLSLKWNNHQSTFLHVLSSLCLNDTLSDVTLACDGEFYAAHKLVLATCSEYFEKIFEKIEGKHSVVVLKDVKSDELETLLSYMYEGEVNVLQDKLTGLIKAAEYLKIKGLSDTDETPEVFSKPFTKKKSINSSKEGSSSPPVKRRRQTTDNSESSPIIESVNDTSVSTEQNNYENNHHNEEQPSSPRDIEDALSRTNQDYDVDIVKEETEIDLKKDCFGFQDESSHFLNDQDDNLPHVSDISLPSMSSQPDIEKDSGIPFITEDGSSTSSHMWEGRGDISNLNSTNRIGSCFVTEADQGKMTRTRSRSDGEHMTITPDELVPPLLSEEEEEGAASNGTFACPFCPFKTFQKNVHDTHLRRHSSEKTFFCQFCSYSCLTKSNLKCHIRKHTGEKPFGCPHCNYRSAQSSNIKIHIKRMHKSAPNPSPRKEAYM